MDGVDKMDGAAILERLREREDAYAVSYSMWRKTHELLAVGDVVSVTLHGVIVEVQEGASGAYYVVYVCESGRVVELSIPEEADKVVAAAVAAASASASAASAASESTKGDASV